MHCSGGEPVDAAVRRRGQHHPRHRHRRHCRVRPGVPVGADAGETQETRPTGLHLSQDRLQPNFRRIKIYLFFLISEIVVNILFRSKFVSC